MYVGSSASARYKQVGLGYGKRSDFTHDNIKDKGESKYDFEKFGSVKYQMQKDKDKSTRKRDTFYSSFK